MNYLQNSSLPIASVGEEVGLELGSKMINEFSLKDSAKELQGFLIGREILQAILDQPNCQGVNFYKAVNEGGENTFVYIGADLNGNDLLNLIYIGDAGKLESKQGIVADRLFPRTDKPGSFDFPSEWEWTID